MTYATKVLDDFRAGVEIYIEAAAPLQPDPYGNRRKVLIADTEKELLTDATDRIRVQNALNYMVEMGDVFDQLGATSATQQVGEPQVPLVAGALTIQQYLQGMNGEMMNPQQAQAILSGKATTPTHASLLKAPDDMELRTSAGLKVVHAAGDKAEQGKPQIVAFDGGSRVAVIGSVPTMRLEQPHFRNGKRARLMPPNLLVEYETTIEGKVVAGRNDTCPSISIRSGVTSGNAVDGVAAFVSATLVTANYAMAAEKTVAKIQSGDPIGPLHVFATVMAAEARLTELEGLPSINFDPTLNGSANQGCLAEQQRLLQIAASVGIDVSAAIK